MVPAAGGLLLVYSGVLIWLGSVPMKDPATGPVPFFLLSGAGVLVGAAYLLAVWRVFRFGVDGRSILILVVAVGLACRLILLAGEPVAEDDYFRYLWDGAVLAAGHSPYGIVPADVLAGRGAPEIVALAAEGAGRDVLSLVAYADLPTIYPPLAQAGFALAHLVLPWDPMGWKLVILAADCVAALLIAGCARALRLGLLPLMIYWWNPILLRTVHEALHMEALLLLPLAAMLFLLARGKLETAAIALWAAIAAKLWPVLAVPILARRQGVSAANRASVLAVGFAGTAIVLAPMLIDGSSLATFAGTWQRNDAIFAAIQSGVEALVLPLFPYFADAGAIARAVHGTAVIAVLAWVLRRPWNDVPDLCRACLSVVAVLFLCGPAVYPWYFLWMLPFLAIAPSWPLLLLSATLPLYDLRFLYEAAPDAEAWKPIVTWAQILPVLALGAWLFVRRRARS